MKRYLVWFALAAGLLGMAASAHADRKAGYEPSADIEEEGQRVRFGGFTFDFTVGDSSGLNAVGENYRNELNFYFEPTWNIGARFLKNTRFKTLSLAGRFAVTQGLSGTDETGFSGNANAGPETPCTGGLNPSSNGGVVDPGQVGYCHPTANDRRTDYSDIWLTLRNPKIYTIPKLLLNVNPALRFILPASAESRYQTLEFAMTPSLGVSRSFWKDHIKLGYTFGFTKNFHQYTSPRLGPQSGSATAEGSNPYDGVTGAGISNLYNDPTRQGTINGYNVSYSFLHSINGTVMINDKWSIDVLYIIIDAFTYGFSCPVGADMYTVDTCASGSAVASNSGSNVIRTAHRDSQVFWLTVGYQPLDWLGLSLAWINWAPMQMPDSSYRQGIISTDYNAYTTVQLAATFTLDKLAGKVLKRN